MSSAPQLAVTYSPGPGRATLPGQLTNSARASLTFGGVFLFVAGIAVYGSGFMSLRPGFFGLRLHPYLIPIILLTPFMLYDMAKFPTRLLLSMLLFLVFYCLPVATGGMPATEAAKVSFAVLTVVMCAINVHSRRDFVAGVLGLSLAALLMAFSGNLTDESATGVIDSGNKNSYSIYALPAILFAGYVILNFREISLLTRVILLISLCGSILSIFLTANRSGHLGVVLIGMCLLWNRKLKGGFYVLLIGGVVAFALINYYSPEQFLTRLNATFEGTANDDARTGIMSACLELIAENPLFGVTMKALPIEIGRKLGQGTYTDSHNLYLHISAANGLICLALLLYMGFEFYFLKCDDSKRVPPPSYVEARQLLRMLFITFAIRGIFTREVLYNPSFCIAGGLVVGLCCLAARSNDRPVFSKNQHPGQGPAADRIGVKAIQSEL